MIEQMLRKYNIKNDEDYCDALREVMQEITVIMLALVSDGEYKSVVNHLNEIKYYF